MLHTDLPPALADFDPASLLTFDERFAKRAGRLSLKPPIVDPENQTGV